MATASSGNATISRWALGVLGAIAVTSSAGMVAWAVEWSQWRGKVDSVLAEETTLSQDVSTTLRVLGDHGSELETIRLQMERVYGELSATRRELLDALSVRTDDRFRGKDWEREKAILDARLLRMQSEINGVKQQ